MFVIIAAMALCKAAAKAAANDYGPAAERDGSTPWDEDAPGLAPDPTPRCIHGRQLVNACPHCAALMRAQERTAEVSTQSY